MFACPYAVTDIDTNQVIPPADPDFPEPLNSVNVTVLATPNARSEGTPKPACGSAVCWHWRRASGCLLRVASSAHVFFSC